MTTCFASTHYLGRSLGRCFFGSTRCLGRSLGRSFFWEYPMLWLSRSKGFFCDSVMLSVRKMDASLHLIVVLCLGFRLGSCFFITLLELTLRTVDLTCARMPTCSAHPTFCFVDEASSAPLSFSRRPGVSRLVCSTLASRLALKPSS